MASPELTAILLDSIGKNLAPNNAFAGVGTLMGQSSLAAKAAAGQQDERKQISTMLARALGGQSLTPAAQPGPTSITFKANPDGAVASTQQSTVTPAPTPTQTPAQAVTQPLPDIRPDVSGLLKALSAPPRDLTGLTPEQINSIMGQEVNMGQLGNQTWDTLSKIIQGNATAQAAKATANDTTPSAEDLYKNALTRKAYLDMSLAIDNHPGEKAKMEAEIQAKLAAAGKDKALTDSERQKIKAEAERQYIVRKMASVPGLDLGQVNPGILIQGLGPNAAADYLAGARTDTRVRDIEAAKENLQKTQKAYAALSRVGTDKGSAADVNEWNSNAPDDATFGLIWTGDTKWFDGLSDNTPLQVQLPQGYTMADVRESARIHNMTVEQVLQKIQEKGQ